MAYNPQIHHRRSIRLKGYDYSQAGAYFITICCYKMHHQFGKITNGEMYLNEFGTIANNEWAELPTRFTNVELDVFTIMPNHMHGILVITEPTVGAPLAGAPNNATHEKNVAMQDDVVKNDQHITDAGGDSNGAGNGVINRAGASPAPTGAVGDVVGAYKSLVANGCLDICKLHGVTLGKLWQRNYWEHIILNEKSYQRISDYIINNPGKWSEDKFYSE